MATAESKELWEVTPAQLKFDLQVIEQNESHGPTQPPEDEAVQC